MSLAVRILLLAGATWLFHLVIWFVLASIVVGWARRRALREAVTLVGREQLLTEDEQERRAAGEALNKALADRYEGLPARVRRLRWISLVIGAALAYVIVW